MLHFPVVYWGRDKGFREEFEHTATSDPTSCLAAPEGIALLREWDFDAVRALHARRSPGRPPVTSTDRWGTTFDDPA